MNYLPRIWLSLLLSLLVCSTAIAGQWEDYSRFMDRFYFLDKQNFDKVSCRVVVSTIDEMLSNIRTQLKPFEDKIQIIEDISEFKLNFNRTRGLSFNLPSFDARIISEDGIRDREQVERGMKYMKNGFQMQIDGVTQMIRGLFEAYLTPKESDYDLKEVTISGDEAKMIYEKEGNQFTDIYLKDNCNSTAIMPSGKSQSYMRFAIVGEKLLMDNVSIQLNQAGMSSNTDLVIDYKQIKGVIFPTKINSKSKLIMGNMAQEGQFEINLKDCTVE
jgi:hypothetical protein